MIMACALAKIIEIIPMERARLWEVHGVADISSSWCEWHELCCNVFHCFLWGMYL